MAYADDETIPSPNQQASKGRRRETGKVILQQVECKKKAALEETNFKALVRFDGARATNDRPGADIVMVVDVSGSMAEQKKLEKLKLAMKFLVKKLGPKDRLSIVSFADTSTRLCPLRVVKSTSQPEFEKLVDDLKANGNTNITDGLKTALQVINDRTQHKDNVGAIMLMSDGIQNRGGNAAVDVDIGDKVPVHTFGFGEGYDPEVLNGIAMKSKGGTISQVDVEHLSAAFSQCLAGLLTVVAQDVEIKVEPLKSKKDPEKQLGSIQEIPVGYPKSKPDPAGSITISFGDIYASETREFLVNLLLFTVAEPNVFDILKIGGTYRFDGEEESMREVEIQVERIKDGAEAEPENEAVVKEQLRQNYIKNLKEVAELAQAGKKDDSKDVIIETQSDLEDKKREYPKNEEIQKLCDGCKYELIIVQGYLDSDTFKTKGRCFVMATLTCHEKQRFSARIDPEVMSVDEAKLRIYATPRMDTYLVQALESIKDPGKPVPNSEDDAKAEMDTDPLGPFAGEMGIYVQTAIRALKAIQEMLKPPT